MTLYKYELPPLPYEFDELEPYIDTKVLKKHYEREHKSYIDNLNFINVNLDKMREKGIFVGIKELKYQLSFNYSGHILHTIYWNSMAPKEKCKPFPEGYLFEAIEKKFVSYGNFLKEFKATALAIETNGWVVLCVIDGELEIIALEKHENYSIINSNVILACDIWEHAYCLDYNGQKDLYINNFFNVVNWEHVENMYDKTIDNFEKPQNSQKMTRKTPKI